MTREEAIKEITNHLNHWKRLKEEKICSEVDGENAINAFNTAIKALEQEPVLDKIRAEIDIARFIDKDTKLCKNANASGLEVALQIIDKYKEESEDEE